MAFKDCIDAIKKASGRDLTDDEADAIYTAVQNRIRSELKAGLTHAEAARKAGKELSDEMRLAIAIEKRSATINALVWENLQARKVEGRETDALYALVTGFQGVKGRSGNFPNAALSVDAMGIAAVDRARGAIINDLTKADLWGAVNRRNSAFERDVVREMWRIDDQDGWPATENKHATEAAAILHKHMEFARLEQNKAGAWIGRLDNYAGRQTHDGAKVRGSGSADEGFRAWREVIEPRLDERTFAGMDSPAERASWLKSVWASLADGIHSGPNEEWMTGFKGFANMAKKVSESRTLHFRSADAWLEYNDKFGHGSVWDTVLHGIDQGHRNASTMRILGTNPSAMFNRLADTWADEAHARGDVDQANQIKSDLGRNSRILERAMHKTLPAHNQTLANVAAMNRNIQMFKLGGVLLTSLTDPAVIAANARHNGIGVLESFSNTVQGLLPGDSAARREFALEVGVGLDAYINSLVNRFSAQDGPAGQMASAAKTWMKFTGLNWMTAHEKEAHGFMLAQSLARQIGKDFSKIPALMQTTLRRYGIEDAEWGALQQGAVGTVDGKKLLFPSSALDLSDAAVAHLGTMGPDRARAALHEKLSTYVIDQTREALSEPTAGIRDMMTGGSLQPGTGWGEIVRTGMQFKTFTASYMVRSLAREVFRDGVNVGGIATLIAGTTALAYVSWTLKDIAAGRNPRKPEDAGDYGKLVFGAMARGGGLGLFGDFLFGEQNRFGGGIAESALGPTFGQVVDVNRIIGGLRDGDLPRAQAEALGMVKSLSPTNHFLVKGMMEYLVFWRLQDMINPGWARRYEQNVKKNNDQTFWLSPTEATR